MFIWPQHDRISNTQCYWSSTQNPLVNVMDPSQHDLMSFVWPTFPTTWWQRSSYALGPGSSGAAHSPGAAPRHLTLISSQRGQSKEFVCTHSIDNHQLWTHKYVCRKIFNKYLGRYKCKKLHLGSGGIPILSLPISPFAWPILSICNPAPHGIYASGHFWTRKKATRR